MASQLSSVPFPALSLAGENPVLLVGGATQGISSTNI